ncbi:hypothetical protein QBC36DRAFT_84756 [Triangularia setosa]|uniref:Uncharacterized protein n=1 Tax=Triangularia setosa TaxID=2587417 RepID=A0AAN6WCU8_9PEZI|nr:hypothetical protein QBC36DRAFT_84756 [Podospora setosa]
MSSAAWVGIKPESVLQSRLGGEGWLLFSTPDAHWPITDASALRDCGFPHPIGPLFRYAFLGPEFVLCLSTQKNTSFINRWPSQMLHQREQACHVSRVGGDHEDCRNLTSNPTSNIADSSRKLHEVMGLYSRHSMGSIDRFINLRSLLSDMPILSHPSGLIPFGRAARANSEESRVPEDTHVAQHRTKNSLQVLVPCAGLWVTCVSSTAST